MNTALILFFVLIAPSIDDFDDVVLYLVSGNFETVGTMPNKK